jgi:hypothetical protein
MNVAVDMVGLFIADGTTGHRRKAVTEGGRGVRQRKVAGHLQGRQNGSSAVALEVAQPSRDRAIRGANDRGRIVPSHQRSKRPSPHSSFARGTRDVGGGPHSSFTTSIRVNLHHALFAVCSKLHGSYISLEMD